jgi:hypothetical protein
MQTRTAWLRGAAGTLVLWLAAVPSVRAQQNMRLASGDTLTLSGFVSATLYTNRAMFGGFGQGQNAEWAAQSPVNKDPSFTDGEIRNTRLRFGFNAAPAFGAWAPQAVLEADFFAPPDLPPPFQDEQPRLRVRLAYADLTNGRTTVRLGQNWAPFFGEVPVSLAHIAFPLGYGSAGMVGWRFPGLFVYHDLVPGAPVAAQLQLAAMKGSGPARPGTDALNNIGGGEASGLPQLEARLNLSRRTPTLSWTGYAVGHYDWMDSTGTGVDGDDMTQWGFEAGGSIAPRKLTLHGNAYVGKALGPQFGHITQFGNIHGWGAWGQAGYDFTPHWSVWAFYGGEQPDAARYRRDTGLTLARQQSHVSNAMLRFRAGRYALGLEYFRADTRWSTGPRTAEQYSLSATYTI